MWIHSSWTCSDNLFPALGFGAQINGQVSHEFALNGNPSNPYCLGIQGVLEAYHKAISCVKLWGPTNFAPIISHVAKFAADAKKNVDVQVCMYSSLQCGWLSCDCTLQCGWLSCDCTFNVGGYHVTVYPSLQCGWLSCDCLFLSLRSNILSS